MTTREMVSYVQKKASQYTTAELLMLIDQIQKMIMCKVTAQREKIDESTGMPPYIATTDGVYKYDCPTDCLRTIAIFAEDIKGYSRQMYDSSIPCYTYRMATYFNLPIKSTDAQLGQLAKVVFVGWNPGTTTTKYYHHYQMTPPAITSQAVNLVIPEQHHFTIIDGVLARIRSERFGDSSEWNFWMKRTMLDVVSELNQGAQPYVGETPTRLEYRHYADPVRGTRIQ